MLNKSEALVGTWHDCHHNGELTCHQRCTQKRAFGGPLLPRRSRRRWNHHCPQSSLMIIVNSNFPHQRNGHDWQFKWHWGYISASWWHDILIGAYLIILCTTVCEWRRRDKTWRWCIIIDSHHHHHNNHPCPEENCQIYTLRIYTPKMYKTLPEAQRTQGIESLTWVISPAK